MPIPTTALRCHPARRHSFAVCLTSIVVVLQPVRSVTLDRIAAPSTTGGAQAGYEMIGRLCIVHDRCGLFTITFRSAPDRSLPALSR